MSRGKIKIEDIVVKRQNDSCVLSAKINDNGTTKELYYGVNERYEGYLVTERSDAFVVALLYYAMFNEYDIEWVVPCDQQLVYQLETYFIPVYSKEFPFMHDIILSGPVTCEKLPSAGAVATGISNGVDSCYTMHKYLEPKFSSMKLSHLIFTNWFITDYSSENQADFMEKYLSKLPNQAESLGLEFVFVDFRVDTLFSIGHINDPIRGVIQDEGLFTLKYCSIALALQKLLGVYYFSGGVSPSEFSFNEGDTAYHDLFTLPLLSSTVQFYSTGMEVSRLEKVEAIADWKYSQKNLQVCALDNECNCGRCGKCIRTLGELYLCDKLDLYTERFPVDDFKKHFAARFAKILVEAHKGHVFEVELVQEMKARGHKIPLKSYVLFPIYGLLEWLRIHLRENRLARKLYRKFNMDVRIYGKKTYAKHLDEEILEECDDRKV